MRLTADIINLVKLHEPTLHAALDADGTVSKKEKIYEFLMTFAEEFDLSADVVEPGKGYARQQARKRFKRPVSGKAAEEFFAIESRPIKASQSLPPKISQRSSSPTANSPTDSKDVKA